MADANATSAQTHLQGVSIALTGLLLLLLSSGALGNLLIVVVVQKQRNLRLSTRLLFQALAVVDLLALLVEGTRSALILLLGRGADPRSAGPFSCRFLTFLTTFPRSASMWILALLSMERFLVARFPMRVRNVQPRRWAVLSLAVIVTVLTAVHGGISITRRYSGGYCRSTYAISFRAVVVIDVLVRQVVPGMLMVLFGVAVLVLLSRHRSNHSNATRMTLAASMVQILLTLPNTLFIISITIWSKRINKLNDVIFFGLRILELSAHGTNIYVYIAVNRGFRRALAELCKGRGAGLGTADMELSRRSALSRSANVMSDRELSFGSKSQIYVDIAKPD